jgi:hypothetical protein
MIRNPDLHVVRPRSAGDRLPAGTFMTPGNLIGTPLNRLACTESVTIATIALTASSSLTRAAGENGYFISSAVVNFGVYH